MRTARLLITTGLLIAAAALVTWYAVKPDPVAGDPDRFITALTAPSAENPIAARPEDAPVAPATGSLGPSSVPSPTPSVPPFTISSATVTDARIPMRLRIPALGQDAPVVVAGVDEAGEMEVPSNVTDVAWYGFGPAPGQPGSSVLAAHVDLAGQGPGVFHRLGALEPGSLIFVDFADGTTGAYLAEARAIYDKDDLPTDALFSRDGPPVLTLITCGGGFNRSLRSYDSNIVVYAVPVGDEGVRGVLPA